MADAMASGIEEEACVTDISCGSSHSVALLNCGVVASWGRGEDGQLGHGQADECLTPKTISALTDAGIENIVCGAEYTIAVAPSRGQIYSWGWGDFGRLGHGDCNDMFVPRPIDFFEGRRVARVACGDTHTLVVVAPGPPGENPAGGAAAAGGALGGELYTFGRNQNGQLGLGHTDDCLSPQRVVALQGERVVSVACGSEHSLATTESGAVYSWGWGRYGNLGDGESQDRHLPTRVVGLAGEAAVGAVCGWRHSAVVGASGRVFTFGWSKYGQLGHGDYVDRTRPTPVAALSHCRVVRVAGGWRHTVAADSEGSLYAWGWNKFGQLGLGDTVDRPTPTRVAGPLTAAPPPASLSSSLPAPTTTTTSNTTTTTSNTTTSSGGGLPPDGPRHDTNPNPAGTPGVSPPPPPPPPSRRVVAVSCGWRHTLAVTAGGEVFSWGRGVNGQLGLGSEADVYEPALLSSLSRGVLRRADILATAPPPGLQGQGRAGYVAPADRYAVVPGADEPYGNGASFVAASAAAVPSMPPPPAAAGLGLPSYLNGSELGQQGQGQQLGVSEPFGLHGEPQGLHEEQGNGRSPKKARRSLEV